VLKRKVNSKAYRSWSKLSTFVENFSKVSEAVADVVEKCEVSKVVVILGSTVISPKETYVIVNDTTTTTSMLSNTDDCNGVISPAVSKSASNISRNLLRSFVTNDIFDGLSSTLPPKKIFILLCLDEAHTVAMETSVVFLPRNSFKIPTRGPVHYIRLSNSVSDDINLSDICDESVAGTDEDEDETAHETGNWYLASLPLQGFK